MSIKLAAVAGLYEKGIEEINQDFIFPTLDNANEESRFFIVCDGMGGEGKGNVASKMVATHIANYLNSLPSGISPTDNQLKQALKSAEDALSSYMASYPGTVGMGTTLSLAFISADTITLAWVGNSPIFFYNKNTDTLLQAVDVKKNGKSGQEVGITQTIYGKENPADLNIRHIHAKDIQSGDFLLVCSDGILEHVSGETLGSIIPMTESPEKLVKDIVSFSHGGTKDDYSCFMIQIGEVSTPFSNKGKEPSKQDSGFGKEEETPGEFVEDAEVISKKKNIVVPAPLIYGLGGLLLVTAILIWALSDRSPYRSFEAYESDIRIALNQGNDQRALALIDSAEFVAKENRQQLSLKALKRSAESLKRENNMSPRQLYTEGDKYFKAEDYTQATEYYRKSYEKSLAINMPLPDSIRERMAFAHYKMGNIFYEGEKENPQKSLTHFKSMVLFGKGTATEKEKYFSEGIAKARKLEASAIDQPNVATRSIPNNNTNPGVLSPSSALSDLLADSSTPKSGAKQSGGSVDPGPTRSESSARFASNIQQLTKGEEVYSRAKATGSTYEYKAAANYFEQAGDAMEGKHAYLLAHIYSSGAAGDIDMDKAIKYAKLSVNKNWPKGHYIYGHLLLKTGNPIDRQNGIEALKKAASNFNDPDAIRKLNELGVNPF